MANAGSNSSEYAELRDFVLALAEFLDRRIPGFSDPSLATTVAQGFSTNERSLGPAQQRQGATMAVSDLLEMTRDFSDDMLDEANAWLSHKGVASLSTMRERVWRRVPKILARGRIRDDAEYYLLVERLNDCGPSGFHDEDRERAARLIQQYESKRAV